MKHRDGYNYYTFTYTKRTKLRHLTQLRPFYTIEDLKTCRSTSLRNLQWCK
jgi:hypothetical protein